MAPDIKATLARAAVIPRALAEEARALLDKNPQAFSPSLLYETATKKKIKDTERRLSEFRAITNDDELWDACERIVATVSAEDSNYTYALVRNDATHLRYKPGGFFKVHQDFLSLQSNCVDEYTLLLSLNTPDEAAAASGGRTLVYREAGGTGKGEAEAYDTTAPGAALLFRKDLDHEGERVKTGTKNLLSLNLLGFRRTTTTQVLLVECAAAPVRKGRTEFAPIGATVEITGLKSHAFNNGRRAVVTPTPDDVAKAGRVAVKIDGEKQALAIRPVNLKRLESVADGVARLLAAANARSFAIPADEVTGMLEAHLRWANRNAEEQGLPPPTVVRFKANCSREAFDVVYRVLRRMHVSAVEVSTHAATLDYFGPFDAAALLLDHTAVLRDAPGFEGEIDMSDPRVICCESAARTEVVASLAKELGLPYVRFKVVFVEGTLGIGGDAAYGPRGPSTTVPLLPAWIELGDKSNLYWTESVANLDDHVAKDAREMLDGHTPEKYVRDYELEKDRRAASSAAHHAPVRRGG